MPIINNPNNEKKEEENKKGIIGTSVPGPLTPSPTGQTSQVTTQDSSQWFKYVLGIVVLIMLTAVGYFGMQKIDFSSDSSAKSLISIEVKRMVRIGSLIDLVEKKIIQTKGSLEQAEKLKDKVIIDTLRLQLSRNLDELDKHQEAFISGLVNIHGFYKDEPDIVISHFKEVLKSNDDAYKLGNAQVVARIQNLIVSVKEEIEPREFFRKSIKRS